jgi:hypothetical protein
MNSVRRANIWRPNPDPAGQTPRETAGLRNRKVWSAGVLRSSAAASEHSEMALSALEKAPFSAVLRHFFDDFPRVFLRACPRGRNLARMRPPACAGPIAPYSAAHDRLRPGFVDQ